MSNWELRKLVGNTDQLVRQLFLMKIECINNAKRYQKLSQKEDNATRKTAYYESYLSEKIRSIALLRAIRILQRNNQIH